MKVRLPAPISGGLMLSYRCNAGCRHCMYACSPAWSPDWLSEERAASILGALAQHIQPSPYGSGFMSLNHGLHFTGGEPFLNFPLLCRCVQMARDLGIPSTFVETNGFWAVTDDETRGKLRRLKSLGLSGILISVNPFYLEYVAFEKTERLIRISREVFAPNVMVYQMSYYQRFRSMGIRGTVPLDEYLETEKPGGIAAHAEFFVSGRAPYALAGCRLFPRRPSAQLVREPCRPAFLRSWHNHFDNYGNFVPGYCGGLALGDCSELGGLITDGIDLEERPVLRRILEDDFASLLSLAKELGYNEVPEGYFSKCHLCVDIRKHMAENGEYPELRPREFYRHLAAGA